ncbi:MAG: pseudouridine synthase [Candidatus Kapaibacteriales bacterium]
MTKENGYEVYSKAKIRLNKLIAESGYVSRRKADELIKQGLIAVNGKIVTKLGTVVNYSDLVTIEGKPIKLTRHYVYVLLNKPKDTICTSKDEKNRKTVVNIVNIKTRIFSVGRLDRNTTGVLLLTNDGELANRLMHPKYKIIRVYNVSLDKPLNPKDAQKISMGIDYNGNKYSHCEIQIDAENPTKVSIALTEGKTHEIKNIFAAMGYTVMKLHRKAFGNLTTKGLKRGEWRFLTRNEIHELQRLVGIR